MSPARTRRTSSASPVSTLSIPIDPVTTSQVCKVATLSARCCDAVQGHLGIQSERAVCGNTPWRTVTMSRLNLALVTMAVLAGACYKDDTTIGPEGRKPMAQVLITDDPFPFDSVQNVWVYIVSIAASTQADTGGSADSMSWVTLAEPHRQVDLLTLQQGLTDSLGGAEVTADQYKAVRVIIDADSSAGIRWMNGSMAPMRWGGAGRQAIHSFVQAAIDVADSGAVIVIDFDVGRSFAYNNLGDGAFDFFPALRAVNRAATGDITGTVQRDSSSGGIGPVGNATVSAWGGGPSNWFILSTGKTDAAGHYRLAYLLPGTYIVGVDPPASLSNLASSLDSNVVVTRGAETTRNITLSAFRGSVFIQGASSMLVYHTNPLEAIVVNAQHQQDPNASVVWANLDTAVLGLVVDSVRFARVTSRTVGSGRNLAKTGSLGDTLTLVVTPSALPSHHRLGGGFRNPWVDQAVPGFGSLLKWMLVHRTTRPRPRDPDPSVFARVRPAFVAPRAPASQLTVTWVGHASLLVQMSGRNILTDPMWSERASPVGFAGPRRWVPPGIALDDLPPLDVVLQSHNHYDHLDDHTVRSLAQRHPHASWVVPLGLGSFVQKRGVRAAVVELDWWQEHAIDSLRIT